MNGSADEVVTIYVCPHDYRCLRERTLKEFENLCVPSPGGTQRVCRHELDSTMHACPYFGEYEKLGVEAAVI